MSFPDAGPRLPLSSFPVSWRSSTVSHINFKMHSEEDQQANLSPKAGRTAKAIRHAVILEVVSELKPPLTGQRCLLCSLAAIVSQIFEEVLPEAVTGRLFFKHRKIEALKTKCFLGIQPIAELSFYNSINWEGQGEAIQLPQPPSSSLYSMTWQHWNSYFLLQSSSQIC